MAVVCVEGFSEQIQDHASDVWVCVEDNVYETAREVASDAVYDHDISDNVDDTVTRLLRDYKNQVDAERSLCLTGTAFEEAVVACVRKAVKSDRLGSSVLQDIQTGVNDVHGVRISRLEKQVEMLLEIFTQLGERCASVTPTNDNQIRIEEVRDSE